MIFSVEKPTKRPFFVQNMKSSIEDDKNINQECLSSPDILKKLKKNL